MNRTEFQQLAEVRLKEAKALCKAKLWHGAYYLAGYAVECGLKACILHQIEREGASVLFEDKKFSEKCWTHDLDSLVSLLGLTAEVKRVQGKPPGYPDVATRWDIVKDWSEKSRYDLDTTQEAARGLINAITDHKHGVLQWIKKHW